MAGVGFEVVYEGEKIYMVGGLSRSRESFNYVEYIEFKVDYL